MELIRRSSSINTTRVEHIYQIHMKKRENLFYTMEMLQIQHQFQKL